MSKSLFSLFSFLFGWFIMSLSRSDKLIAFENGDLSFCDTVHLFSDLVKTGLAWKLQGTYGRTAMAMIQEGLIDREGNILAELIDPKTCPHENLNVSDHRLNYVEDEEYCIVELDYICAECGQFQNTVKSKYVFDSVIE